MKSFIDYIIAEEKIPAIPKKHLTIGNYQTKEIYSLIDNGYFSILTTKESAKNYLLEFISNHLDFPLIKYENEFEEYRKNPKEWEKLWKDFYEDIKGGNSDEGYMFLVINDKSFSFDDFSFDEFIYIIKNINHIEYLSLEAGWGDVVFGGVIQPRDSFEEDEETNMITNTQFDKWITDDRYEIKKIGKTEVVMKDKKYNIKYFK